MKKVDIGIIGAMRPEVEKIIELLEDKTDEMRNPERKPKPCERQAPCFGAPPQHCRKKRGRLTAREANKRNSPCAKRACKQRPSEQNRHARIFSE